MREQAKNPETADFGGTAAQFKASIVPAKSVLILTHDYPDPDCIAAAFGTSHLCVFWGVPSPVVSFGGFVGRAENRAMVRFLDIAMVPFVLIDVKEFEKIILVDSFPGKGNISLPPSVVVNAVIDHHPAPPDTAIGCFQDIRNDIGATSTIITKYLLEAHCPITQKLATALFYGIKTDTGDMRRDVSPHDLDCYKYLFDLIDHRLLSYIEYPDRDVEYFRLLHRAVRSGTSYEDLGYIHLGSISTPDYVAEMADLFHALEKLEWMICSGIFRNQIFFSIRSKKMNTSGFQAERLVRQLGGSGGGHGRAAAGRIQILPHETANNKMEQFELIFKELFALQSVQPEKWIHVEE
ncbi:MAG: DHH family phosphoesterase [Chitinispirillaceae bacterium]|nr:DHH family phosphoesterase [Chitinispirillaceae bacterium]